MTDPGSPVPFLLHVGALLDRAKGDMALRRVLAADVGGGLVQVQELGAPQPTAESYAQLLPRAVVPGDEVLLAEIPGRGTPEAAGTRVVLGPLGRATDALVGQLVPPGIPALPPPDDTQQGQVVQVPGAAGVPDLLAWCAKQADGTFAWTGLGQVALPSISAASRRTSTTAGTTTAASPGVDVGGGASVAYSLLYGVVYDVTVIGWLRISTSNGTSSPMLGVYNDGTGSVGGFLSIPPTGTMGMMVNINYGNVVTGTGGTYNAGLMAASSDGGLVSYTTGGVLVLAVPRA